jgi:hypothetical protein
MASLHSYQYSFVFRKSRRVQAYFGIGHAEAAGGKRTFPGTLYETAGCGGGFGKIIYFLNVGIY